MFAGMCLAQASADVVQDGPLWGQILNAVVSVLVVMFLVPWLKRMAEKARAEANEHNQAAAVTLRERVKASALEGAAMIAELRLPKLAEKILTKKGEFTREKIKYELQLWGKDLKMKLIEEFRQSDGIDLLETVGDKVLDDIVRWAADKTSPFKGKETAVALLTESWSNKLVKFGVDWVAQKWLAQPEDAS